MDLLLELVAGIRSAYVDHISMVNGQVRSVKVSDALVSKIALGMLAYARLR